MILVTERGRSGLHLTPMRVFDEHDRQHIHEYIQELGDGYTGGIVIYRVTDREPAHKLNVKDWE